MTCSSRIAVTVASRCIIDPCAIQRLICGSESQESAERRSGRRVGHLAPYDVVREDRTVGVRKRRPAELVSVGGDVDGDHIALWCAGLGVRDSAITGRAGPHSASPALGAIPRVWMVRPLSISTPFCVFRRRADDDRLGRRAPRAGTCTSSSYCPGLPPGR